VTGISRGFLVWQTQKKIDEAVDGVLFIDEVNGRGGET
jgi:hypothetical protein